MHSERKRKEKATHVRIARQLLFYEQEARIARQVLFYEQDARKVLLWGQERGKRKVFSKIHNESFSPSSVHLFNKGLS